MAERREKEDEPNQVIIHTYMEISQGNNLKQTKRSFFFHLQNQKTGG
jgi:hypothetical protein